MISKKIKSIKPKQYPPKNLIRRGRFIFMYWAFEQLFRNLFKNKNLCRKFLLGLEDKGRVKSDSVGKVQGFQNFNRNVKLRYVKCWSFVSLVPETSEISGLSHKIQSKTSQSTSPAKNRNEKPTKTFWHWTAKETLTTFWHNLWRKGWKNDLSQVYDYISETS